MSEKIDQAILDREMYEPQLEIFDPSRYGNVDVHVVGAGATGSYDTLALAKIGIQNIHVWDADVVERANQPGQLYGLKHVGMAKVDALKEIVGLLADRDIKTHKEMWDGQHLSGIIIFALDSIEGRKQLFNQFKTKQDVQLMIDHRIGGQVVYIYSILPRNMKSIKDYKATLFSPENAAEIPCTQRSIVDINSVCAGMVARHVRTFLVRGPSFLPQEQIWDAFNSLLLSSTD